jgi:putative hydrolase of the HAD superfamily
MRKPDAEIFEMVLSVNKLEANETLFLDDNLSNLEGANRLGINTIQVKNPDQLFELFA